MSPFFVQACRGAVSLEVSGVEHQGSITRSLVCQLSENLFEHTEFAPSEEAIVQRFVRTILFRGIPPPQAVFNDVDDTADDALVIDSGDTVRPRETRMNPLRLALGEIK